MQIFLVQWCSIVKYGFRICQHVCSETKSDVLHLVISTKTEGGH